MNIKFEYIPPRSPQFNGRAERKFAYLWSGVRAVLNAAKLPENLRAPLWAAAARYVELVTNCLVTPKKRHVGSSYQQFNHSHWAPFHTLRPFGTIGIVTTKDAIQAKHKNTGTPMIYVGHAKNHATDVHCFLNMQTLKFIESRDITWMHQMYGDWRQLKAPPGETQISHLTIVYLEEDEPEPSASQAPMPNAMPDAVSSDTDLTLPTPPVLAPPPTKPQVDPHTRAARALRHL